MPVENLYTPKGAGHEAPRERRAYRRPDPHPGHLAMKGYLDGCARQGSSNKPIEAEKMKAYAWSFIPRLEGMGLDDLHSAIALFEDHPDVSKIGSLFSAAYNKLGFSDISFDYPFSLDDWPHGIEYLGYSLRKGSRMVIGSHVNTHNGLWRSEGDAVNHGDSEYGIGSKSKGCVFNFGDLGGRLCDSKGGLGVNFGKVDFSTGASEGNIFVNMGEIRRIRGDWSKGGIILAVNEPVETPLFVPEGTVVLGSDACRKVPGLVGYLEGLRDRLGPHRDHRDILAGLRGLDARKAILDILKEGEAIDGGRYERML